MAKKKIKIKKPKTKAGKIFAGFLACLVIIFALLYVFVPAVNSWVKSMLGLGEEPPFRVEGDTTIVKQEDFNDLEVHFIDVGQGDCILIQLPDYKNVLIDGGPNNPNDVINYLKGENVTTIDYLLATHSDADHIANMKEIFEAFEVKHVFRPYVKVTYNGFTFADDFNKGAKHLYHICHHS